MEPSLIITISFLLVLFLILYILFKGERVDKDLDINKNQYDRLYNKYKKHKRKR